jgi:mediator of RNA polymerase II transcription subunit 6
MADIRNISFMDTQWLQHVRVLTRDNVLDYFALSPFYDSKSNNQAIRAQGVSMDHLKDKVGLEFVVEPNEDEPKLFIIKKQHRLSRLDTKVLEVYYVLDGTIYQSPTLLTVLNARYAEICHYLEQAFEIVLDDVEYTCEGRICLNRDSMESQKSRKRPQLREFPSYEAILEDIEHLIQT